MDTEEESAPEYGAALAPAPAGEPGAVRRRRSWPSIVGLSLVLLVVVGVVAGFVIRVPYTTIAPGEALSLPPLVKIDGVQTYPTNRGDLRLLFVREAYHVNFWQYVRARLDSDIDLAKDAAVNPGALTVQQQNEQGLQAMADAKSAAAVVAIRAAGYKVRLEPGLIVSDLVPKMPAINVLLWGDVIIAADGRKLVQTGDLNAVLAKHKVGDEIALVVERGGKRLSLRVKLGVFTEDPLKGHPGIGVTVSPRFSFPFKVHVDTTGIGGPSAGLAMTLAIFDDLTAGDLTGGRRVAVTGTIDFAGNVGEIGGIAQKAVAARHAHATLFIVPQCSPDDSPAGLAGCKADLARASQRAGSKIKVVPVATFAQALQVLRENGGDAVPQVSSTTLTTIAA